MASTPERDPQGPAPTQDQLRARIDAGAERFRSLPEPPDPRDLITTQDVSPGPDPEGGRDADRDWMLRYGTP